MTEEESRKEDEAIERAAAKHQRALEHLRARQQEKRVAKEPPTKDPEVLQDAPSIQNQSKLFFVFFTCLSPSFSSFPLVSPRYHMPSALSKEY